MSSYTLSSTAYLKIFFHAAKHPHKPVNGVLLGNKSEEGSVITIQDAVPLLHHWTSLSPMMEIGLDLATQYASSEGLKLVGYYQASERLDDTSLAPVGEKVAGKIKSGFNDAVAFVIDGDKLGTEEAALIPYIPVPNSSSWKAYSGPVPPFSKGSSFKLASDDLPRRAVALVRDEHRHQQFGDFDDHLENVSIGTKVVFLRDVDTPPEEPMYDTARFIRAPTYIEQVRCTTVGLEGHVTLDGRRRLPVRERQAITDSPRKAGMVD